MGEWWTFARVEERLVEAFGFMRRLPDRESGWQRVGTMSLWRQADSTLGMSAIEYVGYMLADRDQAPRMPGLTKEEVAAMEEAFGWIDWLPPEQRRIVGHALAQLEHGAARVSWSRVMQAMGLERGKDGLRMRYGRAIYTIAKRLNGSPAKGEGASIR